MSELHGQMLKDGLKVCARHERYFPGENPWREVTEFWKDSQASTGLQAYCKRCMLENKKNRRTRRYKPKEETTNVRFRMESEVHIMLKKLAKMRGTTMSYQANKGMLEYVTRELLKEVGRK